MKKLLLISLLILYFSANLLALKVPGLIITNNDSILVTFKIPMNMTRTEPDFEHIQKSVCFYDSNGKKNRIKPTDANEIQFTINDKLIRMLSRKMNFNTNNSDLLDSAMFLKLEVDGYLKLFAFHTLDMSNMNRNKSYLLQKAENELKWLKPMSIKKELLEYLSDCSSVIDFITPKKSISWIELISIVEKYNKDCSLE
jgi:hypothetical protein